MCVCVCMSVCLYVLLTCHLAQPQRQSWKQLRAMQTSVRWQQTVLVYVRLVNPPRPEEREHSILLHKPSQAQVLFCTVRNWGQRTES